MEYKIYGDCCVIRLNRGEELIKSVTEVCKKEDIKLASVSGLGAINKAVLGLFLVEQKKYVATTIEKELEIASLVGNVSRKDGEVYLHFHAVVSDEQANAYGGHLTEAMISATAEIFVHIIAGEAEREFNDEVGLNLLKF